MKIIFFIFLVFISCKSQKLTGNNSKKMIETSVTLKEIQDLRKEIDNEISLYSCKNSADWEFIGLGYKSCGGVERYVVFPKILKNKILPKIEKYNQMKTEYDIANKIISDCRVVETPTAVGCKDGKPYFLYEDKNSFDEKSSEVVSF